MVLIERECLVEEQHHAVSTVDKFLDRRSENNLKC